MCEIITIITLNFYGLPAVHTAGMIRSAITLDATPTAATGN